MLHRDLTEIVFILDRSGSMTGLESDTIGGFNSLIKKQKKEKGEAIVSCVLFDDVQDVIYNRVPIGRVRELTGRDYYTRGSTALLDAVGKAITHIAREHKYSPFGKPAKTLFVITTDGMENASHEYTYERVRRMIELEKTRYGWEFIFLGANIDAEGVAGRIGIDRSRAVRYHSDRRGTALNYDVVSRAVSHMRTAPEGEATIASDWADDIRRDYSSRDVETR